MMDSITFLWFLLFSMCESLHVAVKMYINYSFFYIYNEYQLSGWVIINGDGGGCGFLADAGGAMAQVRRLGAKVGSRLALFCIHHMNRMNSGNDSESLWQLTAP